MTRDRSKPVRWTLGVSFALALNLSLLAALSYKGFMRVVEVSQPQAPRNISIQMVRDPNASPRPIGPQRPDPATSAEPTSVTVAGSASSPVSRRSDKPGVAAPPLPVPGQVGGQTPAAPSASAGGEPRPDLSGVLRSLNACKDFRRRRDPGDAQCPLEDAAAPDVAPLDPSRRAEFETAQARSADRLKVSDDLRRGLAGHDKGSIVQFGCRMKGGAWKCGMF